MIGKILGGVAGGGLGEWLMDYNQERTHQGKMCCGRTPMATLEDGKQVWLEKKLV